MEGIRGSLSSRAKFLCSGAIFSVLYLSMATLLIARPSEIVDLIKVEMSNVDDLGLVIVWNDNGATTVSECEYTSGAHGLASKEINSTLTQGDNYVIFALYNKEYEGGAFFRGGKWSYSFLIEKNGVAEWSESDSVRNNTRGVKYWKVIKVSVSEAGNAEVSESIDERIKQGLDTQRRMVEEKLNTYW